MTPQARGEHHRPGGEDPRRGRDDRQGRRDGQRRGPRAGQQRSGRDEQQRRPRRRVDPARHAALDVLREVAEEDAYANLILGEILDHHRLQGRDAAFATELAYGALRLQGTHDAVIERCLSGRSLESIDADVLDVLRIGVHQILAMRVPDHAAVSETVDLAAATVGPGPTRLVNAVLRSVARRSLQEWLEELTARLPHTEEPERSDHELALRHAHPAWIVTALREALAADGRADSEGLTALLEADNAAPQVTLVARPGLIGRAKLAEQVEASTGRPPRVGTLSPFALTLPGGPPREITAVRSGKAAAQDEGSQVVALALASVDVGEDHGRWADLCAGPGGKAALLGALAAREGAHLLANEQQPHRAALVTSSVRALPPGIVDVREGDGRTLWAQHQGAFDRVLVDVPCTGLGALRRRPEARWRRTPEAIEELVPLQRELLTSALRAVRVGGVVAYATCSPHVAETREVVEHVLAHLPEGTQVEVLDAPTQVRGTLPADAGEVDLGQGPFLQLWPHLHGTDAMFLALLRRTS